MAYADSSRQRYRPASLPFVLNGHHLLSVVEFLPGREPTDSDLKQNEKEQYRTRYWRCEHCKQERNSRAEFRDQCTVKRPLTPLEKSDYDINEPRTRRALLEEMEIDFGDRGPIYHVKSQSGATYTVDVAERTCTCPDHTTRQTVCKHLRRVDLDILIGRVPQPAGTFVR